MPPGGEHGVIASELDFRLEVWARSGSGGAVGIESGSILRRNPDMVRGADVFFVRADRTGGRCSRGFLGDTPRSSGRSRVTW